MNPEKKKRLEAAGYVVGDVQDLLGLTADEVKLIDLKIQVARSIKAAREKSGITQAELAKRIGSSQPRIAAAETAGMGTTLDLLVRMLFAAGGEMSVGVVVKMPKKAATPKYASKKILLRRAPLAKSGRGKLIGLNMLGKSRKPEPVAT